MNKKAGTANNLQQDSDHRQRRVGRPGQRAGRRLHGGKNFAKQQRKDEGSDWARRVRGSRALRAWGSRDAGGRRGRG